MGEKKYEDPVAITKSHHRFLSTVLGRYGFKSKYILKSINSKWSVKFSIRNNHNSNCVIFDTAKKQQSIQFYTAINMGFQGLLQG